jgi:DNA-binding GntR family transcriptional regulator
MRESAGETSSLAAEAYGIVRRRILRGELELGQVISRRKLAAELGMSFLPVSEALLRLEFEGLLESRPRAGTRVRIPSPEDVRGQFMVREALEAQAAMLFAEVATRQERVELLKLAERVDALASQVTPVAHANVLHQKLHRRIAECARCPELFAAIDKTQALTSTWHCVGKQSPATPPSRRHQELAHVLCTGTPAGAAEAIREHLAWSMHKTMDRLKPYFRLRKATGPTFYRSERKQRQQTIMPAAIAG